MIQLKIDPKTVRGFNYHPSYSTGALESWLLFDAKVWEKELRNGKEKFPKMNTVRIWLSWNAYCRGEQSFIENVAKVIKICKELDLYVIPCLFNRWHDPMVDCDGIYIDHFLPDSSWLLKFGDPFVGYVDALAKAFGKEEQILVWDVCNEPCAYRNLQDFAWRELIQKYEIEWLERMADILRQNHVTQPLGLGTTGREPMKQFDSVCDVYLTHLYYQGGDTEKFENKVLRFVQEAKAADKPLICSECCWGSFDDQTRGEYIRTTLSVFSKYQIGFVAHALQYCGCTDLHNAEDGRVTPNIGNLCFINKDGTLRPYHDAFNEF